MTWARAGLALAAVVGLGLLTVSGDEAADPRTPVGPAGEPAPFLGTAVVGGGELTAAVDAYGDVVDLRPGPAGPALIENPTARQAAGTVDVGAGIVPRVSIGGGRARPLWEANEIAQEYVRGTNVVRTVARFGRVRVTVLAAATGRELALRLRSRGGERPAAAGGIAAAAPSLSIGVSADGAVRCRRERNPGQLDLLCRVGRTAPDSPGAAAGGEGSAGGTGDGREQGTESAVAVIREAGRSDRRWLERARPLGPDAPGWAVAMYERSLLALRALTDARTGAVAAGARDGWAYVWPRDAGTAAIAFAEAGYRGVARQAAWFLVRAKLDRAARLHGDGSPVPGRAAQGDAIGWTAAAAEAAGLIGSARQAARVLGSSHPPPWRDRADYWEGEPGDYLGNALAGGAPGFEAPIGASRSEGQDGIGAVEGFKAASGLVRRAGDPDSGLDSAAAWAVRPFAAPALYPAVRRTLKALVADATPYGITPGSAWHGGVDPWTAPTAWSAWAFAGLARAPGSPDPAADRRRALALLAALRRAATPSGALPERVDARTGVAVSTTPLGWTHAFAVLALRELWPAGPPS